MEDDQVQETDGGRAANNANVLTSLKWALKMANMVYFHVMSILPQQQQKCFNATFNVKVGVRVEDEDLYSYLFVNMHRYSGKVLRKSRTVGYLCRK